MKYNNYLLIFLSLILITFSCNTDDDDINPVDVSGCTDTEAANYDALATIDDGSCIILGCTDLEANNYNPDATNDDGSCEYSNTSILNGNWNIISLEYETEIDLSDIPTVGPLLGIQVISGEASDAGVWTFQYPEYTYNNNLNFTTEPITILTFDVPGIPVDVSSDGNWILTNNDNVLVITDSNTGVDSSYEIISITNTTAIISGLVPFSQEIMGMEFDLDIEMEMILEKE